MKLRFLSILFVAFLVAGCGKVQDVGAYVEGVEITNSQLDQLKEGTSTQSDVEKIIGYPVIKQETKKGEIWKYPYSKIRHFGKNINETTVFEFNKKGVLFKKYKAAGGGSNPLLK